MKAGNFIIISLAAAAVLAAGCLGIVDEDNLEADENGRLRIKGEDSPFTGTSVYYWDGGGKMRQRHYRDGVVHGKEELWYPDGAPSAIIYHVDGYNVITRWHRNGNLAMELERDGNKAHGKAVWYAKDGSVERVAHYEDGVEAPPGDAVEIEIPEPAVRPEKRQK